MFICELIPQVSLLPHRSNSRDVIDACLMENGECSCELSDVASLKALCHHYALKVAYHTTPILYFFLVLLAPIAGPVSFIFDLIFGML